MPTPEASLELQEGSGNGVGHGDRGESLVEGALEREERERLDEVRRRPELEQFGLGRVDAREQHRHVPLAQAPGEAKPRLDSWLDHRGVHADQVEIAFGVGNGFMPQAAHDQLQQSADVVVRFADEYPCHR
jgi:hypothetical protein